MKLNYVDSVREVSGSLINCCFIATDEILAQKNLSGKKSGNGKRRSIFQVGCTLGLWLLAPIVSYSACHTSKFIIASGSQYACTRQVFA